MDNKLSSTAVVKPERSATKEVLRDLPKSYGKTQSFLLPKDPVWMFLFWDIIKATYEYIMGERGHDIFAQSRAVIRVYDITGVNNFNGNNAVSHFDIPVFLDAGSWYISAPSGGGHYICDIGIITPNGDFILLTRSNGVKLPPGHISNIIDDKWMLVEGDYQKLLKLSGADIFGGQGSGTSEQLQRMFTQRWKMFNLRGAPSSGQREE